jgi:rhamnosyltransferase
MASFAIDIDMDDVDNCSRVVAAAVVVSYFPDTEALLNLLITLSEETNLVILVDNGGGRNVFELSQARGLGVKYHQLSSNMGLGYALNFGFTEAVKNGAKYISTFDQDSAPVPGMFKGMILLHKELEEKSIVCGAVGPVFYDRRESVKKYFPFYFEKNNKILSTSSTSPSCGFIEVDTLITSGAMVKASAWTAGLRYDEDLFVDYTDTDFCFRLRASGYRLFACLSIEMGHALSDAPPVKFLGFKFFRYSPVRRYYFFRNTIIFCKKSYVSTAWRRRLMVALSIRLLVNFIIDPEKINSLRMMGLGIVNGVKGVSGEYKNPKT